MHYDTVVQWASVMLALSPDKKPSVLHLNFVGMFVHVVDKQISSLAYNKNCLETRTLRISKNKKYPDRLWSLSITKKKGSHFGSNVLSAVKIIML